MNMRETIKRLEAEAEESQNAHQGHIDTLKCLQGELCTSVWVLEREL